MRQKKGVSASGIYVVMHVLLFRICNPEANCWGLQFPTHPQTISITSPHPIKNVDMIIWNCHVKNATLPNRSPQ